MTLTHYPKSLVLVNGDPKHSGVGEIFLRDLIRFVPPGRMVRFSTVPLGSADYEGAWCNQDCVLRRSAASAFPLLSSLREWRFDITRKWRLFEEIQQIITSERIELIWCIANSPSIISLTDLVRSRINLPIVTTVWDTPEYFALNQWLDPATSAVVSRRFTKLIRGSKRVAVTGEGMRVIFRDRYGVDGISCLHGISEELRVSGRMAVRAAEDFVIAFAGSLYAKREWNALLHSIDSVDGKIAGRAVKIRFIGRFPRTFAHCAPFVECVGTLTPDETISALSTADVAYLPYWFSRRRSYIVKTAFPSKLSSYLTAGLPVLYHGPMDSSPTRFFAEHPVGLTCHSLSPIEITRVLEQFAIDSEVYRRAAVTRRRVLTSVLSQEAMHAGFASLLGISQEMPAKTSSCDTTSA